MDVNYLGTYMSWFSTDPKSNLASLKRTDYQVQKDKEIVLIPDPASQQVALADLLKHLYEEAMFTPLWWVPATYVTHDYVHSEIYRHGFIRWDTENFWMEPH
jgi:hypothetical protein